MDLMDKFLFYEKMSEIDRILNRLPSKEREEFENEWQSMLYSLKRKIWKQRLKKIVISTPSIQFLCGFPIISKFYQE